MLEGHDFLGPFGLGAAAFVRVVEDFSVAGCAVQLGQDVEDGFCQVPGVGGSSFLIVYDFYYFFFFPKAEHGSDEILLPQGRVEP